MSEINIRNRYTVEFKLNEPRPTPFMLGAFAICIPLLVVAQQAAKSDADLARQGALVLATAHGDKPRYGGKFLSVGNEEIPFYDMHQTSLGGIYAAVAPAYNCLIRTSPYDPKGNVNIDLEPMLFSQLRANEVSGNYWFSLLGAAIDFDDPIDTFGQWFVTKGGRWYQRHSVLEIDTLYEQQKFIADPEARKKVIWEIDRLAMNDAAYLILS